MDNLTPIPLTNQLVDPNGNIYNKFRGNKKVIINKTGKRVDDEQDGVQ